MVLKGLPLWVLNKYVTGHVTRVLTVSYSFEDIAIPDVMSMLSTNRIIFVQPQLKKQYYRFYFWHQWSNRMEEWVSAWRGTWPLTLRTLVRCSTNCASQANGHGRCFQLYFTTLFSKNTIYKNRVKSHSFNYYLVLK